MVDEVRTASAVTMGKKEQGGGGGIEPKQEHDLLRWLVNLWAICSLIKESADSLIKESPELSPERNGINSVYNS